MLQFMFPKITWFSVVAALLLPVAGVAAAEVSIETADTSDLELADKPLPYMTVKAKIYTAEIYLNGRIRIFTPTTELVSNITFGLDRKDAELADIRRESDNSISLHDGEPKKSSLDMDTKGAKGGPELDETAAPVKKPETPGIIITFKADRLEFKADKLHPQKTPEGGMAPAYVLAGVFGDTAVAVRNLISGTADALPAERIAGRHPFTFDQGIGQYWPEIGVTYTDGTRVEIRGISGVAHFGLGVNDPYTNASLKGRRGYWAARDFRADAPVTLTITPADAKAALEPAPFFTVGSTKPLNMFFDDEPVRFTLNFAADYLLPGSYTVAWRLEDHCQRPAGEGQQQLTLTEGTDAVPIELKPTEMGFFRAHLAVTKAGAAKAASRSYEFNLARIRPEYPKYRDLIQAKDVDMEVVLANLLGMRGLRTTPSLGGIWSEYRTADGKDIDWAKYDKSLASYAKLVRGGSLKDIVFLMSGSPRDKNMAKWFEAEYPDKDECSKARDETMTRWYTNWARIAGKNGIHAWEPWNEPNLCMGPEGYIDVLKKVYPAIKAGDPQANFLGGSICGLDNQSYVRRLYELGGNKYFDGTSFHPYTGLGFDEAYRAEIDKWWQILRDFKDDKHDLWMTESAWHRGWGFQDYLYDKYQARRESQARQAVFMHLNAEAMGIARNKIYVFYLIEHGYNEFYLFYYNGPTSSAISIQVMNECLRDTVFEKEIPLPGQGQHFLLFKDAQRRVATLYSSSDPAELTVSTDAAVVTVTDLMGNRRELKSENGAVRVTLSGDPIYLVVDGKNTLLPAYGALQVQPNLALTTLGATATASSVSSQHQELAAKFVGLGVTGAISGDWTGYCGLRVLGFENKYQVWGWEEDGAGKDLFPDWYEVKLAKPVPVSRVRVLHEYGGWARSLRDYDVQLFVDNAWKTVGQLRGNYYADVSVHDFAPVTTDRVRLSISMVNSCLFEIHSWLPRVSALRALQVFGPAEGSAKAFFVQDVPRRHELTPGAAAVWQLSLRNVTKDKLSGALRLNLPAGVTVSPSDILVALEPEAVGVTTVKLTLAPDAKEGLYCAVAGLYAGDKLVSSDVETCILVCKRPPEPPKPKPAAAKAPEKKPAEPAAEDKPEKDKKKGKDDLDEILNP